MTEPGPPASALAGAPGLDTNMSPRVLDQSRIADDVRGEDGAARPRRVEIELDETEGEGLERRPGEILGGHILISEEEIFGLTPGSRTRVRVGSEPARPSDLEKFLDKGKYFGKGSGGVMARDRQQGKGAEPPRLEDFKVS